MASVLSANFDLLVSRNAANTAFRDALRLFVGRGRRYSCKQVELGTGIKCRMIESFMAPVDGSDFRKPDFEEVLTLSLFLGAQFSAEWLKLARQGSFDLPDDGDLPPGEIAADNADDNAVIARAARDGVFDNDERPDLKVVGSRMVSRGTRLVAIGSKAA